jgi:hypothetical protein
MIITFVTGNLACIRPLPIHVLLNITVLYTTYVLLHETSAQSPVCHSLLLSITSPWAYNEAST